MTESVQLPQNNGVSINPSEDEDNILKTLLQYYQTFVRPYLWLYPVAVILLLGGGFLFLRTVEPLYDSTTDILVNSRDVHALNVQSLSDTAAAGYGRDFLNTQLMVLKSDEILSKAYEELGDDREFVDEPKIVRLEDLNIISIRTVSKDPEIAMRFANTIVDVYTRFTSQRKMVISKTGTDMLREQLQIVQDNQKKALKDLIEFKEQHGVFDFEQSYAALTKQKNMLTSTVFEVQLDIDEIDLTIEEVNENRKQASTMLPYLMPTEKNTEVASLNHILLQHEMKLPELLTQYNQEHQVIQVHNVVTNMIKKVMEEQVDISMFGLKLRRQRLLKRIEHLNKQISDIDAQLVALDKIEADYRMRENACTKIDSTITMITNRLSELEIADATKMGDLFVTVINDAKIAEEPFFPRPPKILAVSVMGGLAVALMISILLVTLNTKATDVSQVVQIVGSGVPFFGSIPLFSEPENVLLKSNGSETIDEVFRDIRTSLNLSIGTRDQKIIALSSSVMGEGKTFTITNLARSFARDNKRVLLMDFDMRRPRINKILEEFLPADVMKKGLSNVLVGDCKLEDIIIHIEELNLDVAVAGPLPPNPNELIGSPKYLQLLDEVKGKYDMSFIDTPPLGMVSDTLIIAKHVPVLLVTRLFRLPKALLIQLCERLKQLNIQIAGFVTNNADVPKSHYGKYGYGKYGYSKYGYGKYGYGKYGYGYGSSEQSKKEKKS